MGYKFLEHVSDQYVEVYGKDLNELFSSAATAFYETITNTKEIKKEIKREFEMEANNIEDLLFKFLNQLLYLFDTEKFVGCEFKIRIENNKLHAQIYGDKFDPKMYESRFEIKGVTLHNFKIWKDGVWKGRFLLDL